MLGFVISLKSPQASQSWTQVCRLFERCLYSVFNQTVSEFKVIVVCHEKPQINYNPPHIKYIEVDFELPDSPEEITLNVKRTDKGRKLLAGLKYAQNLDISHAMIVDADDCVSRHLAEFVNQSPQHNGWFINRGYLYDDSLDKIFIRWRKFHLICGSCNIVRLDLLKIPEHPEYDRGYGYYKFYIDHNHVPEILAQDGTPLSPLPFPGTTYVVNTGQNIFYHPLKPIYGGKWARILNRRILTPQLREEFSLVKPVS